MNSQKQIFLMALKLSLIGEIAPRDEWDLFFGIDETVSAAKVREFLNENPNESEIEIEISSNGGYVSEGFEIYDLLKNSGKKIKTVGYKVNSIASIVFLAGSERLLSANAQFLIHNAWLSGDYLFGAALDAEELEKLAQSCRESDEKILNAYCEVLGEEKRDELAELMAKDSYLTIDQAINLGFATGKLETETAPELANAGRSFALNEFALNLIKNKKMSKTEQKESLFERFNSALDRFAEKLNSFNPAPAPVAETEETEETEETQETEATAEAQLEAANARISELEAQLSEAQTANETLTSQMNETNQALQNLQTESETLRSEFETLKNEIPGIKPGNKNERKKELSEEELLKLPLWERIARNAAKN